MENEIMNYEDEVMDTEVATEEVETERSGMSTGMAMLIGAGLTLATTAIVKLGKKVYFKFRAKKELEATNEDDFVDVAYEEVDDDNK